MNSPPSSPKRRGRPKTSAKTQPANPAVPEGQHITANVDVLADLVDRVDSKSDLKANMTQRELKFLEIYLTGKHNIDKAMILAGFEGYHPNSLYRLGRKIVQKYEHQAGDHRKIFRAIGAGEVAVAQGLLKLAQNAKSEMVQLNAWTALAKCLGLTKEILEGVEGIQIIINSNRGLGDKPGQHRLAQVNQDQPRALPVSHSITK
jgi:hypothetical protein